MNKKVKNVFYALAVTMAVFTAYFVLTHTCEDAAVMTIQTAEAASLDGFRAERESMRAMERAQLNDIIHDDASSDEIIGDAQNRMLSLLDRVEKETETEGLLSLRGFERTLVMLNGAYVNVLIESDSVTAQDSAAILDIVCRELHMMGGDVKIIPAGSGNSNK